MITSGTSIVYSSFGKKLSTARQENIASGIGLDTLKAFVKEKRGKIELFSHDGYAIIDRYQEDYRTINTFFEGTLIDITVRCDLHS